MKLISGLPRFALAASSIVLAGTAARAVPTASVDIYENGGYLETLSHAQLGCGVPSGPPGSTTTACQIYDHTIGDLRVDIGLTLAEDPELGTSLGIDNLSGAAQRFTIVITMSGVTAIPGGTLMGGSNAWDFGDNTGDGVTLSTAGPGTSLYEAFIDNTGVATLFNDPNGGSDPSAFGGGTVGPADFGSPIPSAAGPALTTNIGIIYDLVLTGGDDASTSTGRFVVKPVPEPATAALVTLGLLGLVAAGRRR